MKTPNLQIDTIQANQNQKEITINEGLIALDIMHGTIKSMALLTPPTSPEDGDCYIIAGVGLGDWADREPNTLTYYYAGWRFLTPRLSWAFYIDDQALTYEFTADGWAEKVSGGGDEDTGGSEVDVFDGADGYGELQKNKMFWNANEGTVPQVNTDYIKHIDWLIEQYPNYNNKQVVPELGNTLCVDDEFTFRGMKTADYVTDYGIKYPYDMNDYQISPPPITHELANDVWHDLMDTTAISTADSNSLILRFLYFEGFENHIRSPSRWYPRYSPITIHGFSYSKEGKITDDLGNTTERVPFYDSFQGYGGVDNCFFLMHHEQRLEVPRLDENGDEMLDADGRTIRDPERRYSTRNAMKNPFVFNFIPYGESLNFGSFKTHFVTTCTLFEIQDDGVIDETETNDGVADSRYKIPYRVQRRDNLWVSPWTLGEVCSILLRVKGEMRIENGMLQVKITDIESFNQAMARSEEFVDGNEGQNSTSYFTELSPQNAGPYMTNEVYGWIREVEPAPMPNQIRQEWFVSLDNLLNLEENNEVTDLKDTLTLRAMQFYVDPTPASTTIPSGLGYKNDDGEYVAIPFT